MYLQEHGKTSELNFAYASKPLVTLLCMAKNGHHFFCDVQRDHLQKLQWRLKLYQNFTTADVKFEL